MDNSDNHDLVDEAGNNDFFGDFDDQPTIQGLRVEDTVLNRFLLKRCLGRGGMGEVWLAHDKNLDEDIALKLLPRMIHFDPQAVDDLRNESKRGRQLSHPNIVRVFDFYQDDHNTGIAMEYVNGDTLSGLRAKTPNKAFSVDAISKWVTEFLTALEYAHHVENVVHRDIKPSNVMIESKGGRLKITDFGIARCVADSMERVTVSAQNRGTLCYMSPEQASGRGVNHLDDIYSVGATLYELLSGTPPFYTGDVFSQIMKVPPMSIVERQRERNFLQPPPPVWEAAIMKCLEKDRSRRPKGAGELLEMLSLGVASYEIKGPIAENPPEEVQNGSIVSTDDLTDSRVSPTEVMTGRTEATMPTSVHFRTAPSNETVATFDLTRSAPRENTSHRTSETTESKSRVRRIISLPVILSSLALVMAAGLVILQIQRDGKVKVPNTIAPTVDSGSIPTQVQAAKSELPIVAIARPVDAPAELKKKEFWTVPGDFDSIQEAIDAAEPGRIIQLETREYAESIFLNSGITLRGNGVQNTSVKAPGGTKAVLSADGKSDFKIEGITFKHEGEQALAVGRPVATFSNCDGVEITNCAFESGITHGLEVTGEGLMKISGSDFSKNQKYGISCESGARLTVKKCTFSYNTVGVVLRGGSFATIEDSKIVNSVENGVVVTDHGHLVMSNKCEISGELSSIGIRAEDEGTSVMISDITISKVTIGIRTTQGVKLAVALSKIYQVDHGIALVEPEETTVEKCEIKAKYNGITIRAENRSGIIRISNNQISDCGFSGLCISGKKARPLIDSNVIGPNGQYDYDVLLNGGGTFRKNTLHFKKDNNRVQDETFLDIDDSNKYDVELNGN
ncbi:MAG: right-handed parallel beta-helix repeat-containing protein [Verrucomicrobiales bacterium]|jgi:serine/threonine protein kinase|nr:right-handed parallel beta-helix repeat-containing protein [Verrucomicrobiales bacterium]